MRTLIFLAFLCGLFSLTMYAQTDSTPVIFQHGLNDKSANIFGNDISISLSNTFYIKSIVPKDLDVSTRSSGIPALARESRNFVESQKILPKDAIYVGHSMGGVAGQWLDNDTTKFKGIVTIGAFFNGAKIANSLKPWWGVFGPSDASFFFQNTIFQTLRGAQAITRVTVPGSDAVWGYVYGGLGLVNFLAGGAIVSELAGLETNGNTVNDFLVGGAYMEGQRNKSTTTPKIALYGEAEVPIVDMWAKSKKFDGVWGAVKDINYAIFSVCRWIPVWGEHPSREGLIAYLYDKEQISGGYMNLISDDVRWQPKVERYMRGFRTVSCFWESVRKTQRACRGWGWFSWLCFPFVYIFNVFTCVTIDTFREESYWYAAPIYGASDGLVNVKTQRGDGAKWMSNGKTKKIDRPVNHNQMGTWRVKEDFEAVFQGRVEKDTNGFFLRDKSPFYILKKN